jgi:hypothetical protein
MTSKVETKMTTTPLSENFHVIQETDPEVLLAIHCHYCGKRLGYYIELHEASRCLASCFQCREQFDKQVKQ